MKKALKYTFALLLLLLIFPAAGWGQGKIFTRKARLADFTTKTTKVVLVGNPVLDAVLRDEVKTRWRISPFEFCTVADYEALKSDPSYYFLRLVEGSSRGERDAGMVFLSLTKAGPTDNWQSLDASFEVIRIPFAASSGSSGREFIYTPAFIDIIQAFVEDAIMTEGAAYLGLNANTGKMMFKGGKHILFSEEDLDTSLPEKYKARRFQGYLERTSTYSADSTFLSGAEDVLIGVVMAPVEPGKGAMSYQLLISADTHELYYYSRHPYRKQGAAGFRKADINFVSIHKQRNARNR